MLESEEQRMTRAAVATEEQITLYVHDPSSRVVIALLENRNITEEHVLIIAGRKNIPGKVLDRIFKDKRWTESYRVRLALAKNPKTPMFTALSIARYLRLFDLAELARNHFLPILYRKKIESIVIEKIPSLALGVKKTLAKTASGEILLFLIQDGYPDVVRTCLDNPHMVEASLYKVINRATSTPGTIRTIAEHRNWTSRYHIKFALVRNQHTPLPRSVLFLPDIKTRDLKELFRDPSLPPEIRPSIHRELVERGENPDALNIAEEETVYEITEGEIDEIEREMNACAGNDDTEPPYEPNADTGRA
jgi:hypothetical protein